MRLALGIALLLTGCLEQTYSDPPPSAGDGGGWGTGPGGTGGDTSFGCHQDADCGTSVCARDGECLPSSDVRTVHVLWTITGEPAGTATCASSPDLDLTFFTSSDQFGFSPVPCVEGKFTIDKLPSWYESVELSRVGDYGSGGASGVFGQDGTATLDLTY
jgi:hypothetical protein